ncbi:MAG: hypothetical protein R3C25_00340 [Hyphomonadaceae bacterium]
MKRNVLSFQAGWRDRLQAMELHLDIRKRIVQERTTTPRLRSQSNICAGCSDDDPGF